MKEISSCDLSGTCDELPDELVKLNSIIINFERDIISLRPLLFINYAAAEEFPKNIPTKIKEIIKNVGAPKIEWEDYDGGAIGRLPAPKNEEEIILRTFIDLFALHNRKEACSASLCRIVLEQSMIANFAFFDAFMGNLVRIILMKQPRILVSDSKISIKEVIEAGSWEKLLENVVDDYVYRFGMPSLFKRFEVCRQKLGIDNDLKEEEIGFIAGAESVRNLLLHAGGIVTEKFVKNSNIHGLKVGEQIPLDKGHCMRIGELMLKAAKSLLRSSAKKHFKATDEQLIRMGLLFQLKAVSVPKEKHL